MALDTITLISNPGSESRKYSLYNGPDCLLSLHFEHKDGGIVCDINGTEYQVNIGDVSLSASALPAIIAQLVPELNQSMITTIGLRIVAPSSYFQQDRTLTPSVIKRLEALQDIAPLHIGATLSEYRLLAKVFPQAQFIGVSDSAFLATKLDEALYYGVPYKDADNFDIKRFGYHGLSLQSVVQQLKHQKLLPERMIVCHLGGGASVAAIKRGKVLDSTMGYSPLEGLMMATRSGSIDVAAHSVLVKNLKLNARESYDYFNSRSGLLGVSGLSSDIRVLLKEEADRPRAKRALDMYTYKIQQAVGAMAATMNGADALVFAGTIGVRSAVIRRRICQKLLHLGFALDVKANMHPDISSGVADVSVKSNPAKVYCINVDENDSMLTQINKLI